MTKEEDVQFWKSRLQENEDAVTFAKNQLGRLGIVTTPTPPEEPNGVEDFELNWKEVPAWLQSFVRMYIGSDNSNATKAIRLIAAREIIAVMKEEKAKWKSTHKRALEWPDKQIDAFIQGEFGDLKRVDNNLQEYEYNQRMKQRRIGAERIASFIKSILNK